MRNISVQPERTTDIDKPNRAITTSNCEKMKPDFIPRGDITFFFRLPYFYETYCTTIFGSSNSTQGNTFFELG